VARQPEDPLDELGLDLLQARSYSLAQPVDEAMVVLCSAEESGNLVDLFGDEDGIPQVKKKVKEEVRRMATADWDTTVAATIMIFFIF
jgi:nicotinamide mononucleotide adenylyltransferase